MSEIAFIIIYKYIATIETYKTHDLNFQVAFKIQLA